MNQIFFVLVLLVTYSYNSHAEGSGPAGLPSGLTATCGGMGSDRDGIASGLSSPPSGNPSFQTPEGCAGPIREASQACYALQDTDEAERRQIIADAAQTPKSDPKVYVTAQKTAFENLSQRYRGQAGVCREGQGRAKSACAAEAQKLADEKKALQGTLTTLYTDRIQREETMRLALVANETARVAQLRTELDQITEQHKTTFEKVKQLTKNESSLRSISEGSNAALGRAASCNSGQADVFAAHAADMQRRLDSAEEGADALVATGAAPATPQSVASRIATQAAKLAEQAPAAVVKAAGGAIDRVAPITGVATKLAGGGLERDPGSTAAATAGTALEVAGRAVAPRLPILGTGPGALLYGIAGNSSPVSRCSEIFSDPRRAYDAGNCGVYSPMGAYANEQAITNLSAK